MWLKRADDENAGIALRKNEKDIELELADYKRFWHSICHEFNTFSPKKSMCMLLYSFDLDCMIHFLDITYHCNVVFSEP